MPTDAPNARTNTGVGVFVKGAPERVFSGGASRVRTSVFFPQRAFDPYDRVF